MSMSKFLKDNEGKSPEEMADEFFANAKNVPTVVPAEGEDDSEEEGDDDDDESEFENDGESEEEEPAGDDEDWEDDTGESGDNDAESDIEAGASDSDEGTSTYLREICSHIGVPEDQIQEGKFPIKRNGEYEWYSPVEYANMAMKGVDYTKKTMELKKYKEQLAMIGDLDIDDNDIQLLKTIKSGDTKKAMTLMAKSAGKSSDEFYQDAADIDEDYFEKTNYAPAQQQVQTPQIHQEVISYYQSLPDSTKQKIKELDDLGNVPQSFISSIMSDPENFGYYVEDVENGVAQKVTALAYRKMAAMTEFEQNKYLNNPSEYIKLYRNCTDELNNGANQPTVKKNPKKVNPDSVRKKNRQNFRKSHNRSVRQEVKNDINRSVKDMVNDDKAMAELTAKYNVEIK